MLRDPAVAGAAAGAAGQHRVRRRGRNGGGPGDTGTRAGRLRAVAPTARGAVGSDGGQAAVIGGRDRRDLVRPCAARPGLTAGSDKYVAFRIGPGPALSLDGSAGRPQDAASSSEAGTVRRRCSLALGQALLAVRAPGSDRSQLPLSPGEEATQGSFPSRGWVCLLVAGTRLLVVLGERFESALESLRGRSSLRVTLIRARRAAV